ncbi:MAG: tetratricopeptide repeat protein [Leptolyngbyaceae bacterium]|nr:tetratricopeptide repeat protein [Leptolyngbyaceae bacterium]
MVNPSPHEQLAPILNQREAGNMDEAIAQLQALLEQHPQFVKGWLELGNSWRLKGDRHQACASYRQILDFAPDNLWAHLQLAQELSALGDQASAETHLQTAAAAHPQHPLPLVRLGQLALEQQQVDIALNWFDQVIQLDPTHPEAYLKKTSVFLNSRNFAAATATLDRLFQHHPKNFWGLVQRAKISQQQGDRLQALQWFRQADDVAPNPPCQRDVQLWILEELQALKQWDDAKSLGNKLVEQWPQHLPVLQRYGAILREAGDLLGAIAIYETILNQYPQQQNLLVSLGDCAMRLGQTSNELEALKRIETRVKTLWPQNRSPQLSHCLLRLGDRYQQHDDWPTALTYFHQILEHDPNHLWANLKVAIAARNDGDLDRAASRIRQTLLHHPQEVELLMHLGEVERLRQQFTVALDCFQQAAVLKPDRLDIQLKMVNVWQDSQQWDRVQSALQTLQQQYPDDAQILIQQGMIDRQHGRRQQALDHFRRAHGIALQTPDDPAPIAQAHWLLIEELREMGQLDLAQQEITTASPEFRQHPRTQMLLGSICQRQQEIGAAAAIYQQILQTQPDHAYATVELARCWSQLGKVTEAIALLQHYATHCTAHPSVLHLLAQLHQSLEAFDTAQQWYEHAIEQTPHNPGIYCGLAECLAQQGDYDGAIATLHRAQQILPHGVQLWLKQVQLTLRYGEVDASLAALDYAQSQFPHQVPLELERVQLLIRCGAYDDAIAHLATLTTDQHDWRKRMLNQRGEIALLQFDLAAAENYYREAIALHPAQQPERMQLARIFLLQGDLAAAHDQLKQATQDLEKQRPPGQVGLPIKNHIGTIINEFYINPLRLTQLKAAQAEEGRDRLLAIAAIITAEPTYLGAIIALATELHQQGVWAALRTTLAIQQPRGATIPKRIIQFWDDPQPPPEVQQLGQTWLEHNPDYEYQRFSLREAIAFLQQHYDPDIVNAFGLCSHPAAQADFFRLAYLNCCGGFYADADDRCRRSLEPLRQRNADLVLYHEDFACFGNNFIGSVAHHPMLHSALYQAADNLLHYSAEAAWSQTGPGLLTSAVCSGLLPYLPYADYRPWPPILVLSRGELSHYVWSHIPLSYKKTEKAWQNQAYPKPRLDHPRPALTPPNPA